MGFATFMASGAGRALRGVAGTVLIVVGAVLGGAWWGLSAVGLVFVAVGVVDVCLLAPLSGQPLSGKQVRGR